MKLKVKPEYFDEVKRWLPRNATPETLYDIIEVYEGYRIDKIVLAKRAFDLIEEGGNNVARNDVKDVNDKSPPFKVGDKVRRINYDWGSLKQGVVYEVERVYGDRNNPHIDLVGHEKCASSKNFELVQSATPETPKSKWFNGKYRVTPETSKLLQEAVFADGGGWYDVGEKEVQALSAPFLYVSSKGSFCYGQYLSVFNDDLLPEKQPPQPVKQERNDSLVDALNYSLTCKPVSIPKEKLDDVVQEIVRVTKLINQQEESKMSNVVKNRRVVSVQLLDNDAGLPVEHSLVHDFDSVVSEDSNDTLIQQLIVDNDLKGIIQLHNEVRSKIVNEEILNRTGQEVMLKPVKLKDLSWQIK